MFALPGTLFLVAGMAFALDPGAPAAKSSRSPAKKEKLAGVANFGKVTPMLFRGAQPSSDGVEGLARLGVALVVDLRDKNERAEEREKQEVTAAGMTFVAIPWDCRRPTDEIVARFLQLLRSNPGKKIFVHCEYGVDRTGLMIATFRMADEGWTPDEAMREMRAFGYNLIHRTWCHALEGYERRFPREMLENPQLRAFDATGNPAAQ
jgi:tyrosine-protein phosphatase SIW14